MTQEDKQLLLQDLSARLPYGVKAQYYGSEEEMLTVDTIEAIYTQPPIEIVIGQYGLEIKDIKPYLRSMSSMTEEELHECQEILGADVEIQDGFIHIIDSLIKRFTYLEIDAVFAFLNRKMFDFRGLIPKDLAISTDVFNPYK